MVSRGVCGPGRRRRRGWCWCHLWARQVARIGHLRVIAANISTVQCVGSGSAENQGRRRRPDQERGRDFESPQESRVRSNWRVFRKALSRVESRDPGRLVSLDPSPCCLCSCLGESDAVAEADDCPGKLLGKRKTGLRALRREISRLAQDCRRLAGRLGQQVPRVGGAQQQRQRLQCECSPKDLLSPMYICTGQRRGRPHGIPPPAVK